MGKKFGIVALVVVAAVSMYIAAKSQKVQDFFAKLGSK